MRRMVLPIMLLVLSFAQIASAQEDRQADHLALGQILKTATEAINTKNFDLLTPILAKEHFAVITVTNRDFKSLEEFRTYWGQLFEGKDAVFDDIQVDPSSNGKTEFLSEDVGVVDGISTDKYDFKNGEHRTMQTRWTAVVKKENGTWKLVKVHFSADLLDNPVLAAAVESTKKFALMSGIAGLVIGALAMAFLRRRKVG